MHNHHKKHKSNKHHEKEQSLPVVSLVDYEDLDEAPKSLPSPALVHVTMHPPPARSAATINLVENRRKASAQMRVDESEQAKAPRLFSHLRKRGWDDLVLGGLSSIGLDSEKYLDHPQDYESHLTLLNLPPVHQSRLKRDLHELSSRKQQQQQQQTPIGTTTTSACEMCGDPVLTPGKQKLCNHCTFYSKA